MSTVTTPSGRIPVTVLAGQRRADLALPCVVPVAELLPSLAGYAGLLDPLTAVTGHQLTRCDGRVLRTDRGLSEQGVTPGTILLLQAAHDARPPDRYDDVVEAVADLRGDPASQAGETARALTRGLLAVLLLLGALGLVSDHASSAAPPVAAAITVVLLLCAGIFSRLVHDTDFAVLAAVGASAYAATCGLVVDWGDPLLGTPSAVAGAASAATAALAGVALTDQRVVLIPSVVTGVVFLAVGIAAPVVDPVAALTVAVAVAAAASLSFPTLAVAATRTGRIDVRADGAQPSDGVDMRRVAGDVLLAHQLVAAFTAAVGLLVLLVAPLATTSGMAATVSVALAALVLALEPAGHRGATAALVGALSGGLGLIIVAAWALWLHPQYRPVLAPALAAAAVLLLVDTSVRRDASSPVRTRICELAEVTALLGLAPAVVLAVGSSVGLRLDLP